MANRADILVAQTTGLVQFNGGGTQYLIQTPTGVLYLVYVDTGSDVAFRKSQDGGFTWSNPVIVFTGTVTLTIPAGGGSACFQLRTVVTSGATSDWSNTACKTFAPATPNPPGNVTVAVVIGINVTPVYKLSGGISRSTFVGFADLGVPCADRVEYSWRGYQFREIPRESVYFWEDTDSRVAAPCAATG